MNFVVHIFHTKFFFRKKHEKKGFKNLRGGEGPIMRVLGKSPMIFSLFQSMLKRLHRWKRHYSEPIHNFSHFKTLAKIKSILRYLQTPHNHKYMGSMGDFVTIRSVKPGQVSHSKTLITKIRTEYYIYRKRQLQ